MSENIMDRYASPEEFIISEINANRGTQNVIDKANLVSDLQDILNKGNFTKSQVINALLALAGNDYLKNFKVGVPSIAFQKKFGISNSQVKKLAKDGIISVTGHHRFYAYGKTRYADTYSPYDYYSLTPEQINKAIKNKNEEDS